MTGPGLEQQLLEPSQAVLKEEVHLGRASFSNGVKRIEMQNGFF